LLRRLDRILSNYDIFPFSSLNQPFNPQQMCAISTDCNPKLSDGVVCSEIVKGYLWKDNVIRMAEVTINKIEE